MFDPQTVEALLTDKFNNTRNCWQYVKHPDFIDIVPHMPNKQLVYERLVDCDMKAVKALVKVFKNKSTKFMDIRALRRKAEMFGIVTYKTESPERLRELVHEREQKQIQQITK